MSDTNFEVIMPLMGEGINEATLVRWLKKPGEEVKKDEPLLEVSTDKVDTEIPAPASGFLVTTLVDAGATVPINAVIAVIGATADAKVTRSSTVATPQKTQASAVGKAVTSRDTLTNQSMPSAPLFASTSAYTGRAGALAYRSSPLVRKMARDQRIDLAHLNGSGTAGRITKRDLLAFLQNGGSRPTLPASSPTGTSQDPLSEGRLVTEKIGDRELLEGVPVIREKMTKMRRLIAEHMVKSVRVSPHVTTVFEIDLHRVVSLREKNQGAFTAREGFKLTYTPFFIHAAAAAIKLHRIVNCSVDGDEILMKADINIGCAVAIESGLIVPVIKQTQDLSLAEIARRLNDLATRARAKKLVPDDVRGGTFSITNPGGYGSITSNPIINQPQVAMLGIGAVIKRPVVVNDAIVIRPIMWVSLTFDHRVVDGEGGAKYLATFKNILENYELAPIS